MGNDFHNDFFGKIVVKIFVVCEGLSRHNIHECVYVNTGRADYILHLVGNKKVWICMVKLDTTF